MGVTPGVATEAFSSLVVTTPSFAGDALQKPRCLCPMLDPGRPPRVPSSWSFVLNHAGKSGV